MQQYNKYVFISIAFLLPLFVVIPAAAQNNYFSWKLGTSQMELADIEGFGLYSTETTNKSTVDDDITAFSIAYGNKVSDGPLPLRMEIEFTFRSALDYTSLDLFAGNPTIDTLHSDINCHTLFANLYLDLLPKSSIVPYVGAGIGITWNIWENNDSSWWDDTETTTGMAWNVGGGVAMKLNRKLMLDVSYKYVDFGEAELSDLLKINEITTNEIQLGLRLVF